MSFTQTSGKGETCKAGIIGIMHFWNKIPIPLKQPTKFQ